MTLNITKADGTVEPFAANKLRHSLRRAGADKSDIEDIVLHIEGELHEGITTQEVYRHAFDLLNQLETPAAARYSLRRGLFNLGPTGFPFETFLARLFQAEGYQTKVGSMLKGKCAEHEIDLSAYREDDSFVAEAKFHVRPGIKSDLQVAMYSYARFLDLQDLKICTEDICGVREFMVITNTKFTSSAEQYGECVGLTLLSWDYPHNNNLHDRIQRAGIYPVTVLQSLSNAEKQILIERDAIICQDLLDRPQVLRHVHISKQKHDRVLHEVRQLLE